jgi:hypothetical protein
MKTSTLLDLLRARHDQPRNGNSRAWVYAEEVRVAPGWRDYQRDAEMADAIRAGAEQRLDAFALHTWPSEKWRRVAYEVKTSTTDLRRELAQPAKCAAALALANEFYLVAGPEVKVPVELPQGWGVMVVQGGRLTITRKAPWRDVPPPPYSFMLSLARNLQATAEVLTESGTAPLLGSATAPATKYRDQ